MMDIRLLIEIITLISGLAGVYIGINTRLTRVEENLKWIKEALIKKEII